MRLRHRIALAALVAATATVPGTPARAGDVVVFAAQAYPDEGWSLGYGAALGSTWFRVLTFEGEFARLPGENHEGSVTTFTGSALLGPPIGALVPYGGLGVGVYRVSLGEASETATLSCLVLGLKLRVKELLVLKAEYRNY
jgi:hypothetical protein